MRVISKNLIKNKENETESFITGKMKQKVLLLALAVTGVFASANAVGVVNKVDESAEQLLAPPPPPIYISVGITFRF